VSHHQSAQDLQDSETYSRGYQLLTSHYSIRGRFLVFSGAHKYRRFLFFRNMIAWSKEKRHILVISHGPTIYLLSATLAYIIPIGILNIPESQKYLSVVTPPSMFGPL
jgi:hypothetical protein